MPIPTNYASLGNERGEAPAPTPGGGASAWPTLAAMAAGSISAVLGLLVLVGWHARVAILVQVHPAFTPMQYNTALGFLLCGLGLIAFVRGWATPARIFGGVAAAIGALTLIEYGAGIDFGIDQLLTQRFVTVNATHPGRMTPNTALSLVLCGSALLLAGDEFWMRRRAQALGLLGLLAVCIGLVALVGFLSGVEMVHGWGRLTRMAAHTAAGFVVLGAGIFALGWRESTVVDAASRRLRVITTFLGVVAITITLWQALEANERANFQLAIQARAIDMATKIELHIESQILALDRMARRWEARGGTPRSEWETDAGRLVKDAPGLQAMKLLNSSLQVGWVVPIEGNEAAQGRFLPVAERQRTELEAARERRTIIVSRSIEPVSKDKGFLVYAPLFAGDRSDGFLLGVYGFRELMEQFANPGSAFDYSTALYDGKELVYRTEEPSGGLEESWGRDAKIGLRGISLRLRIWPGPELLAASRTLLPDAVLAIGLMVAIVLTLMVHELIASYTRDINERKRAIRLLQESEEQLRVITDALPVLVVYIDSEYRYQFANKTAESWYRLPASKVIGRKAKEVLGDSTYQLVEPHLENALSGTESQFEARIEYPDGETRDVEILYQPHFGPQDRVLGIFVLVQDVTERRAIQSQLQQAQKMELVGQLTGGIAHDFNNLLGIVIGNLDILKDTIPEDAEAMKLADAALDASLRGSELNKRLLAFSRRQSLQPEVVVIGSTLEGVEGLLRRAAGESVTVELHAGEELWPVKVDRSQLETALVNLAVNARDAMPKGGKLIVEAENAELDAHYVAGEPDLPPGGYVRIAVTDTGHGMPQEVLERVFEPFFTTKEVGLGTGLGLGMIHGFAKQSGGHVTAYSEVGAGATFKLYLPRAETGQVKAAASEDDALPGGNGERILVVEDNVDMRRVGVRLLRELGYETTEAGTAKEALDLLESGAEFDLVFSDVVMPGGTDGIELAASIRNKIPGMPILLASGFTERAGAAAKKDQRDPSDAPLIGKPYRKDALARAVNDLLKREKG